MLTPGKPRFQRLNSDGLKMIAIVTMAVDHAAVGLIENYALGGPSNYLPAQSSAYAAMWWNVDVVLRLIGRVAFPIFCFQLVEGFAHTGNVKKYAKRLLLFAFISEIPFDLAVFNTWFYPQYQNVFVTLFLGLVALEAVRRFGAEGSLWKQAAAAALCCGLAQILKSDYGAFGVFFILLMYYCRRNPRMQAVLGSLSLLWEGTAPLAFVPIRMYNGEKGNKKWRWLFYGFYPGHLLMVAGIRAALPFLIGG